MSEMRTLVAGVGNIFLSDDGFGSAVARELAAHELPDDVEVVDVGIRGVHLGYQLLDGYRTLVLVDALQRGEEPGTVTTLRTSLADHLTDEAARAPVDPHAMGPDAVIAMLARLTASMGTAVETVYVVGCEPASLDEGIGLSAAAEAAVPLAASMVIDLVGTKERACTK